MWASHTTGNATTYNGTTLTFDVENCLRKGLLRKGC